MTEFIPLSFGIESLYPPMQSNSRQLRDLYVQLADPCRFTEFRQFGDGKGARFASGGNRHLTVQHDRLVFRDNNTSSVLDTFIEDIEQILAKLKEIFQIPALLHSKVLVQLLMPYANSDNSVAFFQKTLATQAIPHFSHFTRPVSGVGLRFVLPPTKEQRSTYHLRIEPYFPDLKMILLENHAQFFDPLVNFGEIKNHILPAYNFLKDEAAPFVLALAAEQGS